MTNEQLCEHYGFKAHQYGFFKQWQDITVDKMKQQPKSDRAEVYRKAFYELLPTSGVEV
jgi:hypothetical protein